MRFSRAVLQVSRKYEKYLATIMRQSCEKHARTCEKHATTCEYADMVTIAERKQFTILTSSTCFMGGLVPLNDYQTIFDDDLSSVKRIYESAGLKVASNQFTTRETVDREYAKANATEYQRST